MVSPVGRLGALTGLLFAAAVLLLGGTAVGHEVRGRVILPANEASEGFRVDVVATDARGRQRRHAIAGPSGEFVFHLPSPGVYRIAVYGPRGAWTAHRDLEVGADSDLYLVVEDQGARWSVQRRPMDAVLPGSEAGGLGPHPLARGRDVAGALLHAPGGTPSTFPGGGPSLLGADPAATPFVLDGFRLADPLTGAPPWSLPLSLFSAVVPHHGLAAGGWSRGPGLELFSRRPAASSVQAAAILGAVAPAGEAQGVERPEGWSGAGALEVTGAAVSKGGRVRGSLALAPGREPWSGDPTSSAAARAVRLERLPVLARVDAEAGGWEWTGTALANLERRRVLPAAPVVPGDDPARRWQDFGLLGISARRALGPSPAELDLRLGLSGSRVRRTAVDGSVARARGLHLLLAGGLTGTVELGGSHQVRLGLGTELGSGRRPSRWPTPRAGAAAPSATARAVLPFFTLVDVYRPHPSLELEWGGRVDKAFYRSEAAETPGAPSFSTGLFFGPQVRVGFRPVEAGEVFVGAARQGRQVPLWALLEASPPPADVPAPAEDVLVSGVRLRFGAADLGAAAVARRLAHALEDRFSVATGRLELFEPRDLRRVYKALVLGAGLRAGELEVRASLIRASLGGTFAGAVDGATGELRPSTTGAWDTEPGYVNHDGTLPTHRPWGGRLFLGWGRPVGRHGGLELFAAGRIDAGTPLDARARSRESGPGQLFVVERGSLGRTGWVSSVDAGMTYGFRLPDPRLGRIGVGLSAFNLSQHRPVVARDPVFSDAVVAPVAGARGRAGLATAVGPDGTPVSARPTFGNPAAWAEPMRLDLLVFWEL